MNAPRPLACQVRPPSPFAVVPTPGTSCVLGDNVAWAGGPRIWRWTPRSIAALGEFAEIHGIAAFWVHPSALRSLGWPTALTRALPREGLGHGFTDERGPWQSSAKGLRAWSYWYRKGAQGFDLHVPFYAGADNPWRACETPVDLLDEVVAFDTATRGVRWCGTAAITSDVFLRRRSRLSSTACPPPVVDKSAAEHALVWHRDPGPDGARFRFLHVLDLNLAYAAAASSLALGTGDVERVDWPRNVQVPGLYLVELAPRWAHPEPPPYVRAPWADEDHTALWVTAPTAERLAQYGHEPLEAFQYQESGRFLRPWYEMLRDARTALLGRPGAALDAVKQVCRHGLGRLAADEGRTLPRGAEYLEDDPNFQPVWAWSVIAETRCRLQRRVAALAPHDLPVAVDTDAVYFLSSRTTPEVLGVSLGLPVGTGLGQFKGAGTASARAALPILRGTFSPNVVGALRDLVK